MKKFNNTPNKRFTVEDSGTIREIWDSRSCAVCIILLLRRGDEYSVLLTRRGEGCPNYVGCWGNVCGYLDRDESIIDAVKRELYEETGLDFDSLVCPRSIKFLGYDDELEGVQNITLRHLVICDYDEAASTKWVTQAQLFVLFIFVYYYMRDKGSLKLFLVATYISLCNAIF